MATCSYCTGDAIGIDEDDAQTCGGDDCMPSVAALPAIVEISTVDDKERCMDCNGQGERCEFCNNPANDCECDDDDANIHQCDSCDGTGEVA